MRTESLHSGAASSMRDMTATSLPCALCGAQDTSRLYTKFDWGIERCRRCGLVYANPRAPRDAILARYSRDYFWNEYLPAAGAPGGVIDDAVLRSKHGPMVDFVKSQAPGSHTLLEIGSGAGLFLTVAARSGFRVRGLELSSDGVAFARDRLGLDVRQEPAERMSLPEASCEVAVMFDVIEHLFEPQVVLAATRRALKPGGLLVVTTPNFDALSRLVLGRDWAVLSPLEHLYYFTEKTLADLIRAGGFREARVVRRSLSPDPRGTMNYQYTHAPQTARCRAYALFVRTLGRRVMGMVQATGRADTLLCVARA